MNFCINDRKIISLHPLRPFMPTKVYKKNWTPDPIAFRRLLEWLDDGVDSEGERYLEIRRRLVCFFDRKGCRKADELADETLNRVARRLHEEGAIEAETPAKFCYITARFVFLESLRDKEQLNVGIDEVVANKLVAASSDEADVNQQRLNCLEHCTNNLEASHREIIFGYYNGDERIKIDNRRELAKKLNLSTNALSIRACRIREKLQICVQKCLEKCG
jgi:DNA-directed RNA polymerase specialized sigma24 family protein